MKTLGLYLAVSSGLCWYCTRRCVVCGEPCSDHIPLRYVLRAWLKHRLRF